MTTHTGPAQPQDGPPFRLRSAFLFSAAMSLLAFGLIVTLGSVAMGTAIMSIGSTDE